MAFSIADLFEHTVDLVPDRTALVAEGKRLTYRELDERANRLAHHLAANGIGRESRVGVYAMNSTEFIETMLAAYKLRAVPINVNYRYVTDELLYLFDNADLDALVYQPEYAAKVAAVAPEVERLRVLLEVGAPYEAALAAAPPERGFDLRSDDDLYILYTGGTTGFPKGVMWRHEDVFRTLGGGIDFMTGEPVADEWTLAKKAEAGQPMVIFPVAPLMHGAAQWATLNNLFPGNTVVLMAHFDPDEVWRLVEEEKVNTVAITGDAMGRPLVDALERGGRDVSSLIAVSSSAAVFSPAVKQRLLQLLPNLIVTDAVGSTETGFTGVTMVQKDEGARDGLNVRLGTDAIVVDDDGKPLEPGSGREGRLARTGNVPLGYYKDPEKTKATFVEFNGRRYALSGDWARLEEDGSMTLLGRGSQCINTGGEKVFPEEVEGVLKAHPAVFDCLVVGVPDERWGQQVTALVAPRPGTEITLEELQEHARRHLAGYKVPRRLHVAEQLPRHPSGKPDYPAAQQLVGAGT